MIRRIIREFLRIIRKMSFWATLLDTICGGKVSADTPQEKWGISHSIGRYLREKSEILRLPIQINRPALESMWDRHNSASWIDRRKNISKKNYDFFRFFEKNWKIISRYFWWDRVSANSDQISGADWTCTGASKYAIICQWPQSMQDQRISVSCIDWRRNFSKTISRYFCGIEYRPILRKFEKFCQSRTKMWPWIVFLSRCLVIHSINHINKNNFNY